MCILSGGHSYLESLVHGGRQQQMTEMRHRTPLHCVDWALVASQAHQKLPRYPCSADFVCKIRLYSRRHFWQNFPGLAPWDLLCWKLWVHCLYWSGKSLSLGDVRSDTRCNSVMSFCCFRSLADTLWHVRKSLYWWDLPLSWTKTQRSCSICKMFFLCCDISEIFPFPVKTALWLWMRVGWITVSVWDVPMMFQRWPVWREAVRTLCYLRRVTHPDLLVLFTWSSFDRSWCCLLHLIKRIILWFWILVGH